MHKNKCGFKLLIFKLINCKNFIAFSSHMCCHLKFKKTDRFFNSKIIINFWDKYNIQIIILKNVLNFFVSFDYEKYIGFNTLCTLLP